MKKIWLILIFIISCMSVSIFTSSILALESEDELYPTIGKEKTFVSLKKGMDNFQIDFFTSIIGGYDTNVKLEHYDPVSSVFIQESFGGRGRYLLFDSCTLKGEYALTSIKYFRFSEPDLLDNVLKAGLDAKITDFLLWSTDYTIDFVGYPHDKTSEYTVNEFETGLRHNITDRLYHKIIYSFSYTHYPKLKTRNRGGSFRLGDREDTRNTIGHELGFYPTDRTFIKTNNTVYFNNSNELYLDYYDYTTVKTKVTAMQLITDKLHGAANFGYQYKAYENRNVSDGDDNERNHLLMGGVSLFYDITPEMSIGTNFDFRKNLSNEGNQKYTDYIISSGLYAKF